MLKSRKVISGCLALLFITGISLLPDGIKNIPKPSFITLNQIDDVKFELARKSTYQRRSRGNGRPAAYGRRRYQGDPTITYRYWGNYYFDGYPNEYYKPRYNYYYDPKYFYGTGNGGVYFYEYKE